MIRISPSKLIQVQNADHLRINSNFLNVTPVALTLFHGNTAIPLII